MSSPHTVLVVGAGLVGSRRAQCAADHPGSTLIGVCDVVAERAAAAGARHGGRVFTDWQQALSDLRPDLVVASTPNRELMPIAMAALEQGASVLVEKPFGRNVHEARAMTRAAAASGRSLKVGFNHRFHPALRRARELAQGGALGELCFVRCCYGHGGRPGYEHEWRADAELAGGGELLDQGVHVVDLLCWLLGRPERVQAELGTLAWPIEPLEDNAFGLLRFPRGVIAAFHTSWSQWQNRFEWQIYGTEGAVEVQGLGGSYGGPTLAWHRRQPSGPPEISTESFAGVDRSWADEWADWLASLEGDSAPQGTAEDALGVMEIMEALREVSSTVSDTIFRE